MSRRTSRPVRRIGAALLVLCATALTATGASAVGDPDPHTPVPAPAKQVPSDTGTREHPYLFTQEQRDNLWWWNGTWLPQSVPSGAHVQVQLPGGPSRWKPYNGPRCRTEATVPGLLSLLPAHVTYLGQAPTLPNEDRIDGYSDLQRFDYTVRVLGIARICLRPHPMPAHPEDIGLGRGMADPYVLSLLVGIPQLSLSSLL
ncbi:MAG: hypothetical protein HOY79_00580 [Streptomyces sp.]|nr:hypothetical protein [Streptomyces sp.]